MAFNFLKISQVHPVSEESDHRSVFPLIQGEDSKFAHTGGQKAVGKGGWGAALKVTEDGKTDLLLQLIFSCIQKAIHKILARAGALGYDHHAVVMAAKTAASEIFNNFVHVVSELGNHGDLGAGGNRAHEGEVAVVTAHDFDNEAAIVGGGGGFDHINEMDDRVEAGIDPDRHFGSRKIIIDRAGQAKDTEAKFGQRGGAGEGAVSTQDKKGLNIFFFENVDGLERDFSSLK